MAIEKIISFDKITLQESKLIPPITYNNITIPMRQPTTRELYDLIVITLQKSEINGVYNPFLVDIYFHLNLVFTYTNITFSEEERYDEFELYDKLNNSGLLQVIIDAISAKDYNKLQDMIEQTIKAEEKYKVSAASLIGTLINDLPRKAEEAAKIIEKFDPEKFQAVIDFATAANGGRPIKGLNKNQNVDKTE